MHLCIAEIFKEVCLTCVHFTNYHNALNNRLMEFIYIVVTYINPANLPNCVWHVASHQIQNAAGITALKHQRA